MSILQQEGGCRAVLGVLIIVRVALVLKSLKEIEAAFDLKVLLDRIL